MISSLAYVFFAQTYFIAVKRKMYQRYSAENKAGCYPTIKRPPALPGGLFIGGWRDRETLNFVPQDLIGIKMQRKAAAVTLINGGVLRLIGIIDNAVFAVFNISMYFHIVIIREPFT